jgi:hypothetical protein
MAGSGSLAAAGGTKESNWCTIRQHFRQWPGARNADSRSPGFAGVVLGDRLLHQAQGLSCIAPTLESRSGQPAEPSFVQETYDPLGVNFGRADQSVAPLFISCVLGIWSSDPAVGSLPSAHIYAATRHVVGEAQSLTSPRALTRHPTGRRYAGCCIPTSENSPSKHSGE